MINKNIFKGTFLIFLFLTWFFMVYFFSSQSAKESDKVSDKVTKELLKVKDTLSAIKEDYKETGKIAIKRKKG